MSRSGPKVLHAIGWLALLPLLGLCCTQWFGIDGRRSLAVLHAVTPYVLVWAAPLALIACLTRRHPLALVSLVPVFTLLTLSYPIVFPGGAPAVAAGSPRLTIAFSNALYRNVTPEEAGRALAATDADVLVVAELVSEFREAVNDAVAPGDYPFRSQSIADGSGRVGMWSRFPIVSGGRVEVGGREALDVVLDVDGQLVRMLAVHTTSPLTDVRSLVDQLAAIGDHVESTRHPTVIVGDFNASRWHPAFRALLDRGWSDAHEALGHGWSTSWPMDRGSRPPPFVRIDHALFAAGITPTAIHDLEIPGSDHKAFVVTLGLTAAALTPEE